MCQRRCSSLPAAKIARRVGKDCTGYHVSLARAELYGEGGASPAAQEPASDDPDSDGPTKSECPIALAKLPDGEEAMSTLEIAELTGKLHKHVLAKARKTLENIGLEPAKFLAGYVDAKGEKRECLELPYFETMTIV